MPDKSGIIGPYGYSGGLNSDASLATIPKGQLVSISNMIVVQETLQPIAGYDVAGITQLPTSPAVNYTAMLGAVVSGHNYLFVLGLSVGNNEMYVLEDFTGSWSSNLLPISGFGAFFSCSYCVDELNSVLTFGFQAAPISGSFPPTAGAMQWTPSGGAVIFPGPANVGIFRTVNNFLIALGSDGTIYWSNVQDSTTWTAGNSITFRYGDGDVSTAIGKIGTNAYIFKLGSIGCLQAQSIVLSGSVVLGPLYTIFDKLGTFSMRSLDNLPTGEIVFVGSDYHVYKFDGSNLTDLSYRPYPQSSVQAVINSFLNSNVGIDTNLIWLRVDPIEHCFYVNMGGYTNFNTSTVEPLCLIYDYLNDYWTESSIGWGDMVSLNLVGNISGFIPTSIQKYFVGLQTNGGVYSISPLYTAFAGQNLSSSAVVSFPYTGSSRDISPRSLIVPVTSEIGNTLTIYVNTDGSISAPISTTVFANDNFNRIIVPINFSDNTMTMQVQFTMNGTDAYSINPFILSEEYLH